MTKRAAAGHGFSGTPGSRVSSSTEDIQVLFLCKVSLHSLIRV